MGAFGLGPDELGEIARPRLHKCSSATLSLPPSRDLSHANECPRQEALPLTCLLAPPAGFQEGIEEGKFGAAGRGIERAVAGGMHSLVIDENGKVSSPLVRRSPSAVPASSVSDPFLLPSARPAS